MEFGNEAVSRRTHSNRSSLGEGGQGVGVYFFEQEHIVFDGKDARLPLEIGVRIRGDAIMGMGKEFIAILLDRSLSSRKYAGHLKLVTRDRQKARVSGFKGFVQLRLRV